MAAIASSLKKTDWNLFGNLPVLSMFVEDVMVTALQEEELSFLDHLNVNPV